MTLSEVDNMVVSSWIVAFLHSGGSQQHISYRASIIIIIHLLLLTILS